MQDEELREQLATWASRVEQIVPPQVSVIRRRARRRTIRHAAGGACLVAAAAAAAAVVLAGLPAPTGHPAPAVRATHSTPPRKVTGLPAVTQAPYYVSISGSSATVRRTATGGLLATVQPPHGARFVSVAAAGDDRTFVLAAQTGTDVTHLIASFYRVYLGPGGRPGPLQATSVPPLDQRQSSCDVEIAGLAVSYDGQTVAVSTLSDCATGQAGPSEIEVASLASGQVAATYQPGNGYPEWLSWTASGALTYDWSGPSGSGVYVIQAAASPGSRARLLISASAGLGGYVGANNTLITPDGRTVIATLGRGIALELAEFSAQTGKVLRILMPSASNPAACYPLWTDVTGRHILATCGGQNTAAAIDNGHLTQLSQHLQLPTYSVPGGPAIAW